MRPEHENPPEVYYNDDEARKYTVNTRVQSIQAEMTDRALELLNLPEEKGPCLLLDIGCGSGLSGDILEECGHYWVGVDISSSMLDVAVEREVNGDLFLQDAGQGFSFRPGSFDGAISISCLQWMCNADHKSHNPRQRLLRFFTTLYSSLSHGSRAVFQFYPENADQIELITSASMQSGFTGGLVIDYPNSAKRKKYFLCLFAGGADPSGSGGQPQLPQGLTDEMGAPARAQATVTGSSRPSTRKGKGKQRASVKDRDWVLRKKETKRRKGEHVPLDSKFTARKRRPKF